MRKIALILLLTAVAVLLAGLSYNPLPLDKKLGSAGDIQAVFAYAAARGVTSLRR